MTQAREWLESRIERYFWRELGVQEDDEMGTVEPPLIPNGMIADTLFAELQRPPWWQELDAQRRREREEAR